MLDEIKLSEKQTEAFEALNNLEYTEIAYGGGAGGGKSYFGCIWLILNCIKYPGTVWLIGRKELTKLKKTTLVTFFKVLVELDIGTDLYTYNQSLNVIDFWNGSRIILMDLSHMPSDPEYQRLGSLEITGGFIDEATEVSLTAKTIISTRIREKLEQYNLTPKMLYTCNPEKTSRLYSEFYRPYKDGKLKDYQCFIPALVTDNPFIDKNYIEQLKKADKKTKERLLFGNWEYDDDPSLLFEMDTIADLFTNTPKQDNNYYISCDVARKGNDKAVVIVWKGFEVVFIQSYNTCLTNELVGYIDTLSVKYNVRKSHIVIDEDGVGGGVVDNIRGCKGFINNSRPIESRLANKNLSLKRNFGNLKTQSYFKFADMAQLGLIKLSIDGEIKQTIISELEQIRMKDIDKEGKIYLEGKDKIKERIGRSPDYADALMMRFYFELIPKKIIFN